ncbi:unnamed protein product [Arabidopsis thaliana]|uniref:(thale cress) hypothetical protein n=1 Tax=Arabidopsis thaliana TaxID=3702 RepID=A0A7G2FJP6_ARATH|nr:unnamed protein product [Arabidopsis thaliana]
MVYESGNKPGPENPTFSSDLSLSDSLVKLKKKPCEVCGSDANELLMMTCFMCRDTREHTFLVCVCVCVCQLLREDWIEAAPSLRSNQVVPVAPRIHEFTTDESSSPVSPCSLDDETNLFHFKYPSLSLPPLMKN